MSDYYRSKIYKKYASGFQGRDANFNTGTAKRWGLAYSHYLRKWLPDSKDAVILDVACGGGALLYFLKERGYTNLRGVDISPEQVKLSKQVVNNVIETDALEFLTATEDTYDLIVGLDFIEHLHKDEVIRFLEACFEKLKSSGRLILQTPNAESPLGNGVFCGDLTHETFFAAGGLQRILRLCGFSSIEIREAGPAVHGFVSMIRCIIWRVIRFMLKCWNLAETGRCGNGILTRVFLISGIKGKVTENK